ncbi:MAG: TolC family protein [Salegentibacter sp.]|uniref:TolC family protein n=1 Tax=Salegentibacter sp. TaxID=1903072 RepID=UPI002870249D|nr:TolC family protein [Salegentibacter sp.]MDR9457630.1 TolC family protein [Salegentibacter sp.]
MSCSISTETAIDVKEVNGLSKVGISFLKLNINLAHMSVSIPKFSYFLTIAIVLYCNTMVFAQTRTVAIVKDNHTAYLDSLEQQLKKEINNLLIGQYDIAYQSFSGNGDSERIQTDLHTIFDSGEADLVIAIGLQSSALLHQKRNYPIPSIAMMVMKDTSVTKTGINNYTFTSPYQSFEDVAGLFSDMFNITEIGVLGAPEFLLGEEKLHNKETPRLTPLLPSHTKIPDSIQGLLIIPTAFKDTLLVNNFIHQANEMGIPSFSIGDPFFNKGWTASIFEEKLMEPSIRKVALDSRHIFEGTNAAEIPIIKKVTPFQLIINMEGVRQIGKLPEWEYLEQSILINTASSPTSETLTIERALAMGIQEKLSLKKSEVTVDKSLQEIKQAKALLRPEVNASASNVWLSDNLVAASLGQKGEMTFSGSLNFQQVLFSEPLFANLAIKKLLNENLEEKHKQSILDAVVNITQNYVSLLLAKADLDLQNENLNLIKQNLATAKNKERLGASKQSDVNRWLSELNLGHIQLNTAQANYKKALYLLNEGLNQPIATSYDLPESIDIKSVFKFPETLLAPYLEDEFLLETLAGFYLNEMRRDAPELQQLRLTDKVISRRIKSAKREFILPRLVGFASANDIFVLEGLQTNPNFSVPPPPQDLTWNAGIGIEFPILDNRKRKTSIELAQLDLQDLEYSKQEVENTLERNIRSQIQQFNWSYRSHQHAKNAATAASANFVQANESYQQGFISITQLLDAQAAKFNAELLVLQTQYKMILDYVLLERFTGKIQLLESDEDQLDYQNRLQQFLFTSK